MKAAFSCAVLSRHRDQLITIFCRKHFTLIMSFPSRLFSRLNKCISFNFSMLLMLSKSVIAPVAPLWSLSHLSASFLEGGVPPWIKQSSWCLTTYEQPVIDTFYVLYTTWPLIFPRNAFTSLFWKKTECHYWLTLNLQLPATPRSPSAVLLVNRFVVVVHLASCSKA